MDISIFDVELALRSHQEAGNITSWFRGRDAGEYRVRLSTGSVLHIKNLFEANAFVSGLVTFGFAQTQREQAEAARIAADEAEREDRLARERVVQKLAVETVDCTTCGQEPGEKCLREPRDPNPYAQKVHEPRRDAALALQQDQIVAAEPVAA
jgi:hypothetical protein